MRGVSSQEVRDRESPAGRIYVICAQSCCRRKAAGEGRLASTMDSRGEDGGWITTDRDQRSVQRRTHSWPEIVVGMCRIRGRGNRLVTVVRSQTRPDGDGTLDEAGCGWRSVERRTTVSRDGKCWVSSARPKEMPPGASWSEKKEAQTDPSGEMAEYRCCDGQAHGRGAGAAGLVGVRREARGRRLTKRRMVDGVGPSAGCFREVGCLWISLRLEGLGAPQRSMLR